MDAPLKSYGSLGYGVINLLSNHHTLKSSSKSYEKNRGAHKYTNQTQGITNLLMNLSTRRFMELVGKYWISR